MSHTTISYTASDQRKDTTSPVLDIITLWPHRSLSQRGFALLLALLGTLAIAISLGFFLIGAWPVIGFMGLELGVLYAAFRLNYRDAKASEQLVITKDGLDLIQISANGTQKRTHFASQWLTAELIERSGRRKSLALSHHHNRHEIGAFLPPSEKKAVRDSINHALSAARLS